MINPFEPIPKTGGTRSQTADILILCLGLTDHYLVNCIHTVNLVTDHVLFKIISMDNNKRGKVFTPTEIKLIVILPLDIRVSQILKGCSFILFHHIVVTSSERTSLKGRRD